MNVITLSHHDEFNIIINASILLTGATNQVKEEIYENMWVISLDENLTPSINKETVKNFIDTLIQQRQEQVTALNYPATLYLWHDEQAAQLRFNILSGHRFKLPFGCKVELQDTIDSILDEFIARGNGYIPLEEIEFLNADEECDEMEILHTVKVFSVFLTPS
jgi:hypothetical protein